MREGNKKTKNKYIYLVGDTEHESGIKKEGGETRLFIS